MKNTLLSLAAVLILAAGARAADHHVDVLYPEGREAVDEVQIVVDNVYEVQYKMQGANRAIPLEADRVADIEYGEGHAPDQYRQGVLYARQRRYASAVEVLELVLDQCSTIEACTWQLRSSFNEVGTKERLSVPAAQEVRIYAIDDLLYKPPRFDDAPPIGILNADSYPHSYGIGGSLGAASGSFGIQNVFGVESRCSAARPGTISARTIPSPSSCVRRAMTSPVPSTIWVSPSVRDRYGRCSAPGVSPSNSPACEA